MKNVIVGTAGHIDHGKTSLIRALTGRDTDRLKEEKERGISIELGFTYFDLPSGRRAGIIDVPGHEKFIKNMLAGVGGIDVVILVIAADEGVMPQTREHLNILKLLHVKKGIVALTKKDMVDPEWLEMISEQVSEEIKGTFLEEASIIPVSSVTKEGLPALVKEIDRLTESVEVKDAADIFRLPIDRVFTITGFGTVVTGTLISGNINEGDRVIIYPRKTESRVRSIQVHEKSVKTAYAGQRVAINLAGLKVEDLQRGDVLATPGSMEPTMMLDARLELLADEERPVDNRDRLRLYHGTSEIMCRVVLLDREELKPGESAFVQLRLEEEIACHKGDRFVIRFYSPMITIGGGTVLDPNPPKRKRFKEDVIEELKVKEQGEPEDIVEQYLIKNSEKYPDFKLAAKSVGSIGEDKLADIIQKLIDKKAVMEFRLGEDRYLLHRQFLDELEYRLTGILEVYHKKNPLKAGMSKEELKTKTMESVKPKLSDAVFTYFADKKAIKIENQYVSKHEFKVAFSKIQEQLRDYIMNRFKSSKFNPPKLSELIEERRYDKNQLQVVYGALLDMGELIKVDEEIAFTKEAFDEAVDAVKKHIGANSSIQLGQFRDILGTSRKYAMALLDCFDQMKITKRVGDNRVLY